MEVPTNPATLGKINDYFPFVNKIKRPGETSWTNPDIAVYKKTPEQSPLCTAPPPGSPDSFPGTYITSCVPIQHSKSAKNHCSSKRSKPLYLFIKIIHERAGEGTS
jgi:hypothetical protein